MASSGHCPVEHKYFVQHVCGLVSRFLVPPLPSTDPNGGALNPAAEQTVREAARCWARRTNSLPFRPSHTLCAVKVDAIYPWLFGGPVLHLEERVELLVHVVTVPPAEERGRR